MSALNIGISDALYLAPIIAGLNTLGVPNTVQREIPAKLALMMSEASPLLNAGCAFLSPIDYGRHGGDYRIVPRISISSSRATGTITLYINQNVRNIHRLAVDIRMTSEIILAKIILLEKFSNLSSDTATIQFIPMMPNVDEMLAKADAALVVNHYPGQFVSTNLFAVDLVQEWRDLTELPYVHGIWVGREDRLSEETISLLIEGQKKGESMLRSVAEKMSPEIKRPADECQKYLESFRYSLGEAEEESLSEFFRYAYYHGSLGDVPECNFFPTSVPPAPDISAN